jgi:hypothetical protein
MEIVRPLFKKAISLNLVDKISNEKSVVSNISSEG